MNEQDCQASIVAALASGQGYPHAVNEVEVIETHISWVFLAGDFAYKLKKAIRLNYLDFTGLENRRQLCEDELRLNRRFAPEIYVDVAGVGGSCEQPVIGDGDAIDYVLRMRRFPQSARLDQQLESGRLTIEDMRALARSVARLHLNAAAVPFVDADSALHRVVKPIEDNYPHVARVADAADLERVRAWSDAAVAGLSGQIVARHRDGFVREGHGDLHLANLVRLDDHITAFDCVEFSPELRNIDVVSDTSFLVMDLAARGRFDLAYTFLNRYLELTGDYAGMALLDLYVVYHCMIRAKVAAIRRSERSDDEGRRHDAAEVANYMRLALRWIERPAPQLVAMHGFSGSGKTWLSEGLGRALPAIRIRTDVERKRRLGVAEAEATGSGIGEGAYSREARTAVYDHVLDAARGLLEAGHTVVVDASLLDRPNRVRVRALAAAVGVPYVIVDVFAADDILAARLAAREASADEASEAGLAVLDHQRRHADPLDEPELARTIRVDAGSTVDFAALAERIRHLA